MMQAVWNDTVIAESDDTVVVEGNHYFPPEAVDRHCLRTSETRSRYPWKGRASHYSVVVDGSENRDAAWYYPDPLPAAASIAGRIAFWHGVKVVSADAGEAGGGHGDGGGRGLLARLLGR